MSSCRCRVPFVCTDMLRDMYSCGVPCAVQCAVCPVPSDMYSCSVPTACANVPRRRLSSVRAFTRRAFELHTHDSCDMTSCVLVCVACVSVLLACFLLLRAVPTLRSNQNRSCLGPNGCNYQTGSRRIASDARAEKG